MNCSDFRIPRGYGYNPSDEELLRDLKEKNNCNGSEITTIIPEIDLCKYEPRQLPELVITRGRSLVRKFFIRFSFWLAWSSQRKWYFFTPRDYKFTNSIRSNRTTGEGFYKITGKNRAIRAPGSRAVIGWKRTLTFYLRGKQKPLRTGWVLHEYYLTQEGSDPTKQIGEFVVCCLKYKSDNSDHDKDAPFCNPGIRNCSMASNAETGDVDPISNGNEDEAETGGGIITEEEEDRRAYKKLKDDLQIPNGNTDVHPDDLPTVAEGNLVDMMIKELLDDPDSLDSLFLPHDTPQLHQSPMRTTDVCKDECRKRTYPFEGNDPSLPKKNNISTNDDDKLVSNSTSSFENQAANVIPEGSRSNRERSPLDSFLPKDYDYAHPSINGGPREFSNDNDFIGLDDLPPIFKGNESPLAQSLNRVIDGGSGVTSDRNDELVYECANDYALYFGARPHCS